MKYDKEWFNEAFKGVNVPDYARVAASRLCKIYNIGGVCDPAYIANLITRYAETVPTVCSQSATGEHSDAGYYCEWCHQPKVYRRHDSSDNKMYDSDFGRITGTKRP